MKSVARRVKLRPSLSAIVTVVVRSARLSGGGATDILTRDASPRIRGSPAAESSNERGSTGLR